MTKHSNKYKKYKGGNKIMTETKCGYIASGVLTEVYGKLKLHVKQCEKGCTVESLKDYVMYGKMLEKMSRKVSDKDTYIEESDTDDDDIKSSKTKVTIKKNKYDNTVRFEAVNEDPISAKAKEAIEDLRKSLKDDKSLNLSGENVDKFIQEVYKRYQNSS
jgi:hypothetical protein